MTEIEKNFLDNIDFLPILHANKDEYLYVIMQDCGFDNIFNNIDEYDFARYLKDSYPTLYIQKKFDNNHLIIF